MSIDPSYADTAINGWHHAMPTIAAVATDTSPSSGFKANAITLFFDSDDLHCGVAISGTSAHTGADETSCFSFNALPNIDGVHKLTARSQDIVGNNSQLSRPLEINMDTQPPTSAISLIPAHPDGNSGYYRSKPLVAFSADDVPGGSGVDFENSPSGVRVKTDTGNWHYYDTNHTETLSDGTHRVCFYAIDAAGNKQSGVEGTAPSGAVSPGPATAPRCQQNINVDSTAPVARDGLSPASPGGAHGYYTTKPTITPTATDGRSGIDRVQQSIDDGDWVPAARTTIPDGMHEIRVRAFDRAGNASDTTDRVVLVDTSAPTQTSGSFPPAANGQGWFRQTPSVSMVTHDGRDASGPDGGDTRLDGAAAVPYLAPISIADGEHDLALRPRDRAGLLGPTGTRHFRVDQGAPTVTVSSTPPANILLALLGQTATFNFTVGDARSPHVKARVMVYDELGVLVRTIVVPGPYTDGYRDKGAASVVWNARNNNNNGVLPGTYYFRVQAADEAGNTIVSTESPEFVVVPGLLPLHP